MNNNEFEEDEFEENDIIFEENANQTVYELKAEEETGIRADVYISDKTNLSRSSIKKASMKNALLINGIPSKVSTKLKSGDVIKVTVEESIEEVLPEDIPINIIYEDECVIVVNKESGMVVHPSPGHMSGTLVNALLFLRGNELSDINGEFRPGIVHRIDKDTSGLLVIAKSNEAHLSLEEQLREHTTTRKYYALVHGKLKEKSGTIDKPLIRGSVERKKIFIDDTGNGRKAVTHYNVIEEYKEYSLVECILETGRTHQIRVHMKSIGHPVAGDPVYSGKKTPFKTTGQMLHAKILGFINPKDGVYKEFDSQLPEEFENAIKILRQTKN